MLMHSCFALCALASHGLDQPGSQAGSGAAEYTEQHLQAGLQVAYQLGPAAVEDLERHNAVSSRSRARFMRQELIRLETGTLRCAPEPLRQQLRAASLRFGVAASQCKALLRDAESNEVDHNTFCEQMSMALVLLGLCGQAEHTAQLLQQAPWEPMVKSAAQASVELSRLGAQAELERVGMARIIAAALQEWQVALGSRTEGPTAEAVEALHFAHGFVAVAA